jgi:hypothetical protein
MTGARKVGRLRHPSFRWRAGPLRPRSLGRSHSPDLAVPSTLILAGFRAPLIPQCFHDGAGRRNLEMRKPSDPFEVTGRIWLRGPQPPTVSTAVPANRSAVHRPVVREFESLSLRNLVSSLAGSLDISLKTPEFLGFSAPVGRRRPSPRGHDTGSGAAVSVRQFCGSVSLLTG